MDKQILKANPRDVFGRKVKTLRQQAILPANIFGKKIKSEAIQINTSDFLKVYKEVGETSLITLKIEKGKNKKDERVVLVSNIQTHPVTDEPIHVDFHQVNLKEKVSAQVPVEVAGESPAEKEGRGTLVQYVDEIEVEALPANLPDSFTVEISSLNEVDMAVQIKDIKIDSEKIKILDDPETIVVKVEPPQKEEEVLPPKEEEVEEEEKEASEEEKEAKEPLEDEKPQSEE